jgi:translation initiation factor 2 alpha subunit (eIF-2alpha)
MLNLDQLQMVVNVLRVNESGTHIDVALFSEEVFDLS